MFIKVVLKDHQSSPNEPTRVLVRPIGLDVVEVGGSNPPGPTKYEKPGLAPGFSYLTGCAQACRAQPVS